MTRGSASPTVSVIIATYNWSGVLRLAMESVLRQTFADFELLVIGDACTDDSEAVVASFKEERVRWRNLEKNSGSQSLPNNAGLEMARGKYVAYLGHDDLWLPHHLQTLVETIEKTGADFVYGYAIRVGPAHTNLRNLAGATPSNTYERGFIVPPTCLMHKREVVEKIGKWKDYRELVEPPDNEFLIRAYDGGMRFEPVHRVTAFKFNSTWWKNSYVDKPTQIQREYLSRMQTEPDFLEKELQEVARVHYLGIPQLYPKVGEAPLEIPKGWYVTQFRKMRGLEPEEEEAGASENAETPKPPEYDFDKINTYLRGQVAELKQICDERMEKIREIKTEADIRLETLERVKAELQLEKEKRRKNRFPFLKRK